VRRRKERAPHARTWCHEAIMELPAVVVATLLSILYHLIWQRKIDTFRICGTKVPICRDGKIELTSLQLIWSKVELASNYELRFWELTESETRNLDFCYCARNISGILTVSGYSLATRDSQRIDEMKGERHVALAGIDSARDITPRQLWIFYLSRPLALSTTI